MNTILQNKNNFYITKIKKTKYNNLFFTKDKYNVIIKWLIIQVYFYSKW